MCSAGDGIAPVPVEAARSLLGAGGRRADRARLRPRRPARPDERAEARRCCSSRFSTIYNAHICGPHSTLFPGVAANRWPNFAPTGWTSGGVHQQNGAFVAAFAGEAGGARPNSRSSAARTRSASPSPTRKPADRNGQRGRAAGSSVQRDGGRFGHRHSRTARAAKDAGGGGGFWLHRRAGQPNWAPTALISHFDALHAAVLSLDGGRGPGVRGSAERAISTAVVRSLHTGEVAGSNPASPTIQVGANPAGFPTTLRHPSCPSVSVQVDGLRPVMSAFWPVLRATSSAVSAPQNPVSRTARWCRPKAERQEAIAGDVDLIKARRQRALFAVWDGWRFAARHCSDHSIGRSARRWMSEAAREISLQRRLCEGRR